MRSRSPSQAPSAAVVWSREALTVEAIVTSFARSTFGRDVPLAFSCRNLPGSSVLHTHFRNDHEVVYLGLADSARCTRADAELRETDFCSRLRRQGPC